MTSPDSRTDPPPITPKRLAFLIAVPLAWGALLWFHPAVGPDSVITRISATRYAPI